MSRGLIGLTVAAALALGAVPTRAEDMPPPCRRRPVNVEHASKALESEPASGSLCVQGSQVAVHLEVRQTTTAAVLAALSTAFKISYRSSIALNETRDGTYVGSLDQVVSRLLDGYDYVVKRENASLDVSVFGRKGAKAVAAPISIAATENSAPRRARGSRTR